MTAGTASVGSWDATNMAYMTSPAAPADPGCATCAVDGATKLMGAAFALAVAASLY